MEQRADSTEPEYRHRRAVLRLRIYRPAALESQSRQHRQRAGQPERRTGRGRSASGLTCATPPRRSSSSTTSPRRKLPATRQTCCPALSAHRSSTAIAIGRWPPPTRRCWSRAHALSVADRLYPVARRAMAILGAVASFHVEWSAGFIRRSLITGNIAGSSLVAGALSADAVPAGSAPCAAARGGPPGSPSTYRHAGSTPRLPFPQRQDLDSRPCRARHFDGCLRTPASDTE